MSEKNVKDLKGSKQAVILGGRSWVGFRLAQQLYIAGWSVICTTTVKTDNLQIEEIDFVEVGSNEDISKLIDANQPNVIINLSIGIKERDFFTHQLAAKSAEKIDALYVYSSSALALDGYQQDELLLESLKPLSDSPYGIFKGRCEIDLNSRENLRSLILRFSSIHGWSPWKDSRTVALLKRVSSGEEIKVNQGVIQNRCTDIKLAECIYSLINHQKTGVAHIGTSDASEEIDFLKRLSTAFGYSANCIVADEIRSVNLAVIPSLGLHPKGALTEADTINLLLTDSKLQKYKRTTN